MSQVPPGGPPQPSSVQGAIMVMAVGIALVLFGTLIATLSPNGRTPGLVILGIGAMLSVPGYILLRHRRRRMWYRVTRRWSPWLFLAAIGVFAAIVAGSVLIVWVMDTVIGVRIPGVLLFVPGGLLVMRYYWELRTAIKINHLGIVLGGVPTLWAAVDQLVLSEDGNTVKIEVSRRADVPAQEHEAVPVELPSRRVVLADLVAAVRRFGPAGIRVVKRQGLTSSRCTDMPRRFHH